MKRNPKRDTSKKQHKLENSRNLLLDAKYGIKSLYEIKNISRAIGHINQALNYLEYELDKNSP